MQAIAISDAFTHEVIGKSTPSLWNNRTHQPGRFVQFAMVFSQVTGVGFPITNGYNGYYCMVSHHSYGYSQPGIMAIMVVYLDG